MYFLVAKCIKVSIYNIYIKASSGSDLDQG